MPNRSIWLATDGLRIIRRKQDLITERDCRIVCVGPRVRAKNLCGHEDWNRFHFMFKERFRFPSDDIFAGVKCPHCLLRETLPKAILCAECGRPIFPGDEVATPLADSQDELLDWVTMAEFAGGRRAVVTCACGENARGVWGRWTGDWIRAIDEPAEVK